MLGMTNLFRLAWIEGDTAGMDQQVAWSAGKDSGILRAQAVVASFGGQFQESRNLRRRALEILERDGAQESRANVLSSGAVFEARMGNLPQAREAVKEALGLARGRWVLYNAALVEAFGGATGPTQKLLEELLKMYPQATLVNKVTVPVVQATLEVSRGNPDRAVALLEPAAPYEFGTQHGLRSGSLSSRPSAPAGRRQGKRQPRRFGRSWTIGACSTLQITLQVPGSTTYSLAYLGLGRAQALAGNASEARKAYQNFLALWKDADSDIPILKEAKAEYAKLR